MSEKIKKGILKKFMYNETLSYSQIWDKSLCSSSHLDYYIKQLLNSNLIKKEKQLYTLTPNGIEYITKIDGKQFKENKKPVFSVFVLGVKDNNFLLSVRKKQPFYNHLNIPGGKVEFGHFSIKEARREFKEETGLLGDLTLKIVSEKITQEEESGEIAHHIIAFFYLATGLEGKFIKQTREGINVWLSLEELKDKERFQELDEFIPHIINGNTVKFVNVKRTMSNGKIVDYSIEKEF